MIYRLRDVRKSYHNRTVLRVESLAVQAGEILAIVGPSGAGKSTLLRLLALLEAPTQGDVSLHIKEGCYNALQAPVEIKRQLAMVFQRPVLLSRTVYENVSYGLKIRGMASDKGQLHDVLKRLSILHLAGAKPNTLSGGEMQRVSIARAMILQPQILLLDEPTANLDPHNVRIIEQFLSDQHRLAGTTIIIVTHNIFQAKRLADRIGLLYDGELVEVAETAAFFENPVDERTAAFTSGYLIY